MDVGGGYSTTALVITQLATALLVIIIMLVGGAMFVQHSEAYLRSKMRKVVRPLSPPGPHRDRRAHGSALLRRAGASFVRDFPGICLDMPGDAASRVFDAQHSRAHSLTRTMARRMLNSSS